MCTEMNGPQETDDRASQQELYETLVAISVVARQLARDTLRRVRQAPEEETDKSEFYNEPM